MHCFDRTQAEDRVRMNLPGVLKSIAHVEEMQLMLEGAAALLDSESAEHVRDAATALRRASAELRDAEAMLSDVTESLRRRDAVRRPVAVD